MDIDIQILADAEEINDIIALQTKCLLEINSQDYSPKQIKSLIKSQKNARNLGEIIFLAKQNKQLVGFASILTNRPEIGGIYVHPQYNGLGIGKKLLTNIEKVAIEKRYKFFHVTSSITAVKFYQSQGYQKISKSGFLSELKVWIPTVRLQKQLIPFTFWEQFLLVLMKIFFGFCLLLFLVTLF